MVSLFFVWWIVSFLLFMGFWKTWDSLTLLQKSGILLTWTVTVAMTLLFLFLLFSAPSAM